jgi:phospholipase/lecithinase/hemolysin
MVDHWTSVLLRGHEEFRRRHSDVRSAIFNPAPVFHEVLDNPIKYGAPNNTCASMLEHDRCLWRDSLHPGLAIHQQMGSAMFELVQALDML